MTTLVAAPDRASLLAAGSVLAAAADLVAERGHHPAWTPSELLSPSPYLDMRWQYHCPLSGVAALYAVVDPVRGRAPAWQPPTTPALVLLAADLWRFHLVAIGAVEHEQDGDGYVQIDPFSTLAAYEPARARTTAEVVRTMRDAAAHPERKAAHQANATVTGGVA